MDAKQGRREFVKTAAAAIATSAFPILGANDRVQLGIVGLGGRGRDHINYYSKLGTESRIAGVCDVNQSARERAIAQVRKLNNYDPKEFTDMRAMFDSKEIDAVSLPLPNHWHALATIWACQAGKDVYVEKPATHNLFEAQQVVAAARKYNRMVQVGSQSRSITHKMNAMKLLGEGVVGQVYHSRGLCFRRRFSIGHTPDAPVPPGLDWDRFLGPAQWKPYSVNKFAYNWHWFWDTGNGDIGNQGVHEMDICLWGLGRGGWPVSVSSTGGRYQWKDDAETPNTQISAFDFGDAMMTFDVRNMPTAPEGLAGLRVNQTANIFFGDQGYLVIDDAGFQVYKSTAKVDPDKTRSSGAARFEKYEKTMDEKAAENDDDATTPHMRNFIEAIRARDYKLLHADIAIGARAAAFCHLANLAYRTGKTLRVSPSTGRFIGADDANALYTRDYREPYVVPARWCKVRFPVLLFMFAWAAVGQPTTREMNDLNWMEFREWVPSKIQTVLLPTGTLEAHGVVNNGADNTAPVAIARAIARDVAALVAPVVNYGMTGSLDAYAGGFSIGEKAYRAYMTDVLEGLARQGFRNIIVINGHGGPQTAVLNEITETVGRERRVRTMVINWWALCSDITQKVFGEDGGHAGWNETAFIQSIDAKLVHKERYADALATPRPAPGTWSAYPFPSSIILYQPGQGYVKFDQAKADEYFKAVVERMTSVAKETIAKWDKAGIFEQH